MIWETLYVVCFGQQHRPKCSVRSLARRFFNRRQWAYIFHFYLFLSLNHSCSYTFKGKSLGNTWSSECLMCVYAAVFRFFFFLFFVCDIHRITYISINVAWFIYVWLGQNLFFLHILVILTNSNGQRIVKCSQNKLTCCISWLIWCDIRTHINCTTIRSYILQ